MPQNDGWSIQSNYLSTVEINPAGYLHVSQPTPDVDTRRYELYRSDIFDGVGIADFFFIIKAKIISNAYDGMSLFRQVSLYSGFDFYLTPVLYLFEDRVVLMGDDWDNPAVYFMDTTDDYHVYNCISSRTDDKTYLYVDGVYVAEVSISFRNVYNPYSEFKVINAFGDSTSPVEVYVDYIYFGTCNQGPTTTSSSTTSTSSSTSSTTTTVTTTSTTTTTSTSSSTTTTSSSTSSTTTSSSTTTTSSSSSSSTTSTSSSTSSTTTSSSSSTTVSLPDELSRADVEMDFPRTAETELEGFVIS